MLKTNKQSNRETGTQKHKKRVKKNVYYVKEIKKWKQKNLD